MSTSPTPVSKKALWTGRVLSTLPVLAFLLSAVMKFTNAPGVADGMKHFGIPAGQVFGLGLLEAGCTLVYLVPRTSVLGAILLTGYLGGAILTAMRVGDPVYLQAILGVLLWGGIFLREPRLRALLPLKA